MTDCKRPLRRRTEAQKYQRGRMTAIIVEIPAGGRTIGFRLAKTRKTYYLPTADLLAMAIRVHVAAERDRKKAERAAKKKPR